MQGKITTIHSLNADYQSIIKNEGLLKFLDLFKSILNQAPIFKLISIFNRLVKC